jgi:hypothetical protein
MLVLFTLGFGMLIGAQVAGMVEEANTPPEAVELRVEAQTASPEEAEALNLEMLQLKDWRTIWTIPCVAAAVVMVVFLLVFREDVSAADVSEEDVADAAATEEMP